MTICSVVTTTTLGVTALATSDRLPPVEEVEVALPPEAAWYITVWPPFLLATR